MHHALAAMCALPGGRQEVLRLSDPHGMKKFTVHDVSRFLESMRSRIGSQLVANGRRLVLQHKIDGGKLLAMSRDRMGDLLGLGHGRARDVVHHRIFTMRALQVRDVACSRVFAMRVQQVRGAIFAFVVLMSEPCMYETELSSSFKWFKRVLHVRDVVDNRMLAMQALLVRDAVHLSAGLNKPRMQIKCHSLFLGGSYLFEMWMTCFLDSARSNSTTCLFLWCLKHASASCFEK